MVPLAKFACNSNFTRTCGGYIYNSIVNGIINQLITGGAPPCILNHRSLSFCIAKPPTDPPELLPSDLPRLIVLIQTSRLPEAIVEKCHWSVNLLDFTKWGPRGHDSVQLVDVTPISLGFMICKLL